MGNFQVGVGCRGIVCAPSPVPFAHPEIPGAYPSASCASWTCRLGKGLLWSAPGPELVLLSSPQPNWPWYSHHRPQTHDAGSSNPERDGALVRALGQERAGGRGARQARLTSSPQSLPQLFLMAQNGVSEPGEWCGGQGVRAPSTLHSSKSAVGPLCDRY